MLWLPTVTPAASRRAGVLTKRIQGTRGYTRLRKDDLDQRFPGLMDSIITAEAKGHIRL